jgi:DNA-binding transcriptional LysR family regulator
MVRLGAVHVQRTFVAVIVQASCTMLSLARLRVLRELEARGTVGATARALGYSPSAVSQQLATLEREAGVALVDRSQRPLRPTRAGEALRPHVRRVLAALGGAANALEDVRGGTERLRLAAFTSALSSFVPAALRDLRRAHAGLVVQVLQLETQEAIDRVRDGGADLAVVHHMPGVAVPDTTGLERRPLLVDDLHVVLPERHRLARREEVSVADLAHEPLVLPRRDTPAGRFRSVVEHLCARAGVAPLVAYELDDLPAAQAFVAAGMALVPMHGLTLATVPAGAVVRPLAERPAGSRTIEALAAATGRAPVVDELLERLASAARAYLRRRSMAGPGDPRPGA